MNECLVTVSNDLRNNGGIAGEDSRGVFPATCVLRVTLGASETGSVLSDWTGALAVGAVAVNLGPGGGARISACPPPKTLVFSCRVAHEPFRMLTIIAV